MSLLEASRLTSNKLKNNQKMYGEYLLSRYEYVNVAFVFVSYKCTEKFNTKADPADPTGQWLCAIFILHLYLPGTQ